MTALKWSAPLVLLAVAGSACHTRPQALAASKPLAAPPAAPARPPAPPPPPAAAARPAPAPLSDDELFRRKSVDQLNAEHPLGDAFFDYDQDVLRDDARAALQQDATWLTKWPQTHILIQGHCDERGTAEYNLALGDRRAQKVREYLTGLGISGDRIATRTLGKESPFCVEEGEACWSQNRRGHFVLTAK